MIGKIYRHIILGVNKFLKNDEELGECKEQTIFFIIYFDTQAALSTLKIYLVQ